jgi:alkylation response protein AidB-like acyl-CoA dehydrogenase
LLAELRENGDSLASNPVLDAELARAEVDMAAHEMMVYRIIDGVTGIDSNAAASMIKARGAELQQRISGLWIEALGPHALPVYEDGEEKFGIRASPGAMSQYLIRRAVSIYGGANEIQYNIIAKRGLHL